jgi:hypothetical protein
MPVELPIASLTANWSESVALDGVVYRLTFKWNTRSQSWSMTIAEDDGTPIVSGIKILPQISLLQRHKDERLPKGVLYAFDVIEGDNAERPTRTQLGNKLKLIYTTRAELEALVA